jgi:hypothetical protein
MVGMRLGGIDPSILRELSGVYKPFVKAFKELVSNAFDADAEVVRVFFADDFSSVAVTDDGQSHWSGSTLASWPSTRRMAVQQSLWCPNPPNSKINRQRSTCTMMIRRHSSHCS